MHEHYSAVELSPDIIFNILQFSPLVDIFNFRVVSKDFFDASTKALLMHLDQLTKKYGFDYTASAELYYKYKINSSERTGRYEYDEYDLYGYAPQDIYTIKYQDETTIAITKHDRPLEESEFLEFIEMNEATEGFAMNYHVNSFYFVFEHKDRPIENGYEEGESAAEVHPSEQYTGTGSPTGWNSFMKKLQEREAAILNILRLLNHLKVMVAYTETGERFANNYMYDLYFWMPDGKVWQLHLSMQSKIERYTSYNE
jgi:hypothetical protein